MISRTVARRYAKGLLGAVLEAAGEVEAVAVGEQLDAVAEVVGGHGGLRLVLVSPAILWEKKAAVLDELARRVGSHELLHRFLRLLAEKERLDHLQVIADAYRGLVDEHRGVITATVTAPTPIGDEVAAGLRSRLGALTGREVRLETRTDPALLGGMVTRIGDIVYDGSLRTHLRKIREQLEA